MFVGNVEVSRCGFEYEASGLSDRDSSRVSSSEFSGRYLGFDEVSGSESEVFLFGIEVTSWKPVPCKVGSFVSTPAHRFDFENSGVSPEFLNIPDAGGVHGVGFTHAEPFTIPFGLPTGSRFNGESGALQTPEQGESGGIDGCGRSQAALGAGEDPFAPDFVFDEVSDVLRAFGGIAGYAGNGEVSDSIGTSLCPGYDVFHIENLMRFPAVGTGPVLSFEEVFLYFVTGESSLLVLDSRDLRVLQ